MHQSEIHSNNKNNNNNTISTPPPSSVENDVHQEQQTRPWHEQGHDQHHEGDYDYEYVYEELPTSPPSTPAPTWWIDNWYKPVEPFPSPPPPPLKPRLRRVKRLRRQFLSNSTSTSPSSDADADAVSSTTAHVPSSSSPPTESLGTDDGRVNSPRGLYEADTPLDALDSSSSNSVPRPQASSSTTKSSSVPAPSPSPSPSPPRPPAPTAWIDRFYKPITAAPPFDEEDQDHEREHLQAAAENEPFEANDPVETDGEASSSATTTASLWQRLRRRHPLKWLGLSSDENSGEKEEEDRASEAKLRGDTTAASGGEIKDESGDPTDGGDHHDKQEEYVDPAVNDALFSDQEDGRSREKQAEVGTDEEEQQQQEERDYFRWIRRGYRRVRDGYRRGRGRVTAATDAAVSSAQRLAGRARDTHRHVTEVTAPRVIHKYNTLKDKTIRRKNNIFAASHKGYRTAREDVNAILDSVVDAGDAAAQCCLDILRNFYAFGKDVIKLKTRMVTATWKEWVLLTIDGGKIAADHIWSTLESLVKAGSRSADAIAKFYGRTEQLGRNAADNLIEVGYAADALPEQIRQRLMEKRKAEGLRADTEVEEYSEQQQKQGRSDVGLSSTDDDEYADALVGDGDEEEEEQHHQQGTSTRVKPPGGDSSIGTMFLQRELKRIKKTIDGEEGGGESGVANEVNHLDEQPAEGREERSRLRQKQTQERGDLHRTDDEQQSHFTAVHAAPAGVSNSLTSKEYVFVGRKSSSLVARHLGGDSARASFSSNNSPLVLSTMLVTLLIAASSVVAVLLLRSHKRDKRLRKRGRSFRNEKS